MAGREFRDALLYVRVNSTKGNDNAFFFLLGTSTSKYVLSTPPCLKDTEAFERAASKY